MRADSRLGLSLVATSHSLFPKSKKCFVAITVSSSEQVIRGAKGTQLTTDGSRIGNPSPAGRACILCSDEHERELIGRDSHSTNNRMELKAAIEGLLALEETCEVEVVTDSEYLLREVTERLARWKSNG